VNAKRPPVRRAAAVSPTDRHSTRTPAETEAFQRIHSAVVVLDAIDTGVWPCEVEIIDGTVAVLEAASRWQLVAELEAVFV
jgi:hypothetical protein